MRGTVTTWVWGLGLMLQMLLLGMLVVRGWGRRLPAFTLLMGFYGLRSAALFVASRQVTRGTLGSIYGWLSTADLLLQMLVLAEVVVHVARGCGGWTIRRGGVLGMLAALAAGGGWGAGLIWGTHGRVSIDRGQAGLAILFALMFCWCARLGVSGFLRREMEGFALFSAASVVSQVERYRAALARDGGAYTVWSYGLAGVYLLVLVFWLAAVGWRRFDGRDERIGVSVRADVDGLVAPR